MKTHLPTSPSLLDAADGKRWVDWFVVYYPRTPYFFWTEWMKQGFRHCDLWRPYYFGDKMTDVVWLRLKPTFEALESFIEFDPTPPWIKHPGATVQRVQVAIKAFKMREWFAFGPPSCVETCKNALGIRSFRTRTPWQLYQYIKRRGGVIE
jgi:hypothetical protein